MDTYSKGRSGQSYSSRSSSSSGAGRSSYQGSNPRSGGSSYQGSSPRFSRGGSSTGHAPSHTTSHGHTSHGGHDRFARTPSRNSFNPKRGFRKDRIDEKLFINKAPVVNEAEAYISKNTFADFGVHPILAENLAAKGFVKPSPIQDQSIPVVLQGGDVIGIASTGTGKTAAFLIPLIDKLVKDREHKVMILTPTRELAQQIEQEFRVFTAGMKLFSVSCVGGAPITRQIQQLEKGVHVIIGTPGRVKDLIERKKIKMNYFESIVLDEADRMLDMGFVDDMRSILGGMPENKQGLFFSATFSPEIKRLCGEFLRNPITVSVKTRDTASSVDQDVIHVISREKKIEQLHDVLTQDYASKVLIFREMKRSVDELAAELQKRGFKALALHGDMRNRERERAVKSLGDGSAQIVIATDVAARGIDIADISLVVNYDVPSTYETYVHRIGRTGRANKTGKSLTFI